jgi:hypothetical protein
MAHDMMVVGWGSFVGKETKRTENNKYTNLLLDIGKYLKYYNLFLQINVIIYNYKKISVMLLLQL